MREASMSSLCFSKEAAVKHWKFQEKTSYQLNVPKAIICNFSYEAGD
jgi:hypothetical protein